MLERIFSAYARGGYIPLPSFVKLMRDANVIDSSATPMLAEASFGRASRVETAGSSGIDTGRGLSHDQWVAGLMDVACRKYGVGKPAPGNSGVLADAEAFRRFVSEHILPLASRMVPTASSSRGASASSFSSSPSSSPSPAALLSAAAARGRDISALLANFADDFLQPNVLQVSS